MDSIDYYERYGSAYFENTVNLSMEEQLEQFLEYLPENAEVLDLGCGSGRDGKYLEEAGCYVTLMDGSRQMCRLAEIYTDQEVLCMTFEEMTFDEVFDGIWACASLLHVPGREMDDILEKVIHALKPGGILYMSFYYGEEEGIRNHRFFHDYTEQTMTDLLRRHPALEVLTMFATSDSRGDHSGMRWLNVFARKEGGKEDED